MQFKLASGHTITITPAQGADVARLAEPFQSLATNPPTDPAAQAAVIADLAQAFAPYIQGLDVADLGAHFREYPNDMAYVGARVLGSNTHTPRGKQRR